MTSGNPYFVAEVLAAGDVAGVPLTIADAVRARLAHLDPAAREILEQLAVVPSAVQRWLVEELVPAGLAALAPAEQRGLLDGDAEPGRASATSWPAARWSTRCRRPAGSRPTAGCWPRCSARPGIDVSRVVHHAAQAGDAGDHSRVRPDRGP